MGIRRLKAEETIVLDLLRKAIAGQKTGPESSLDAGLRHRVLQTASEQAVLDAGLWHRVLQTASEQAVLPLLYENLENHLPEMSAEDRIFLRENTLHCVRIYYELLWLTARIQQHLQKAGIHTVVLKGAGIAAAYPVPACRRSGDIDLLLDRQTGQRDLKKQVKRAEEALKELGFQKNKKQTTVYHIVFTGPRGIALELHTFLTEPLDSRWANRCIRNRIVSGDLGEKRIETEGQFLVVPEEAGEAFTLLVHMLHHFLRAGFGLKLLSDWTVFWNRIPSVRLRKVRERYLRMVRACGMEGFSDLITSVCRRYLGLTGLQPGKFYRTSICADFLTEVFSGGEFGEHDRRRTVILRGTAPVDYLRAFLHQTRLNYPAASRVLILYPALWACTLLRFLRNNRTVRRSALQEVLRSAGDRSRFLQAIHLFERPVQKRRSRRSRNR